MVVNDPRPDLVDLCGALLHGNVHEFYCASLALAARICFYCTWCSLLISGLLHMLNAYLVIGCSHKTGGLDWFVFSASASMSLATFMRLNQMIYDRYQTDFYLSPLAHDHHAESYRFETPGISM